MSRLEVIAGPMFSGKTFELVRRVHLAEIACQKVAVFRPVVDTRHKDPIIWSRGGVQLAARVVENPLEVFCKEPAVIGIDEAQFFEKERLLIAVRLLLVFDKRVIVAGLDLDYAEKGYGPMPELLALADEVLKTKAVCMVCHSFEANRTQRLIDGKAAPEGEQLVIDMADKYRSEPSAINVTYEARCAECFVSPLLVVG